MFQRREQEGAEPSAFGAQAGEIILLEETREKRLGQILGILLGVAAPADIGVERKPVGAAQFLQRPVGLRRGRLPAASTTVQCVVAKMSPGAVVDGLECSGVKRSAFTR